jgi:CheY-like chemotaxis protein
MAPPKLRILLVEDVPEMMELLVQAIESSPVLAVSGRAANTFEARQELLRRRPTLVLLDEVLPGESALDFAAELEREGIPFILITGMESPDHPVAPGARGRLQKPEWRTLARDQAVFTQSIVDLMSR